MPLNVKLAKKLVKYLSGLKGALKKQDRDHCLDLEDSTDPIPRAIPWSRALYCADAPDLCDSSNSMISVR
jgi:hypothetical protein